MVQNNTIQNNNIFNSFPRYNLTGQKKMNPLAGSALEDDSIYIRKKAKKKKILFGSTLASTILTAGILGLVFAKGFHGGSFKKLSKITEHLSDKIAESSHKSTKNAANSAVYYARKGTKRTIEGLQATSNFTAFKDWMANKLFRKTKVTSAFANKSTSVFKKIVDKTLGKQYSKAEIKVRDMSSLLKHYSTGNLSELNPATKIKIKNETYTLQELTQKLSSLSQQLENTYDNNFSLGARKARDKKRTKLISNVSDEIYNRFFKDKNSLFKLKNYTSYVTEDVTKDAQKTLEKEILKGKREVTNNISHIYGNIKNKLNNFSEYVKPSDSQTREAVQNLKQNFDKFKSCSGQNESELRQKISTQILENIDNLKNLVTKSGNYNQTEQQNMLRRLEGISKAVEQSGNNSKGILEEIMTLLKGLNKQNIMSDTDYKEFSKMYSGIKNNLDKAANLEAGEYFLKQAELKVGSAPTDVLSLIFPIGTGAIAIATGEDKDEKISKVLNTCIPLVGTFATFIYGTTKMMSGAKNLIFSFVSGAILGKIGSYCDKLYQKYKQTGSITNIVKDEYTNLVSDIVPKDYNLKSEQNLKNKK